MSLRGLRFKSIIGLFVLCLLSVESQAQPPGGFSAQGCAKAILDMIRMISLPAIKRPAFFVSKRPPAPEEAPHVHVYFETKYIKQLRDKAHLSPSQVDRLIKIIKQSLFRELLSEGINPIRVSNDYKSIRLELNSLDPAVIERISSRALEDFNQEVDREFSSMETRGRSIRKMLEEIPGYSAPFSIGIGRNLNEAGIAARITHLPSAPQGNSFEFSDRAHLLYEHFLKARDLHRQLMESMSKSISPKDLEMLTTRWGESQVLRPEVNDLLRKSVGADEIMLQLHRRFRMESVNSTQTVKLMSEFYNAMRVFEPPLAYKSSAEADSLEKSLNDLSTDDSLSSAADFLISVDIRRVGAFHASALQSMITNPAITTKEEFIKMIDNLSYGDSQKRYEDLMTEAESLLSKSLTKSDTLASKASGDEIVRYFKGPYSYHSIANLLKNMTPDMRATLIPLQKFRTKGVHVTDDEINEMRHVAETLAKTIHEELGDEFGASLADDFNFLVELEPSLNKADKFEVKIHFQALKTDHASLIELALQRIKESAKELLNSRGLPMDVIHRISSIKTRSHKVKEQL